MYSKGQQPRGEQMDDSALSADGQFCAYSVIQINSSMETFSLTHKWFYSLKAQVVVILL